MESGLSSKAVTLSFKMESVACAGAGVSLALAPALSGWLFWVTPESSVSKRLDGWVTLVQRSSISIVTETLSPRSRLSGLDDARPTTCASDGTCKRDRTGDCSQTDQAQVNWPVADS